MGRNRPTNVELYLRVLGRDGLRMCILLLDGLAGKYLRPMAAGEVGDLKSRQRFMQQNAKLQGELGQFYAPYHHFCPACDGCCHHAQTPYGPLDLVLYGLPPALSRPAMTLPFAAFIRELGHYVRHYLALPFRWVRIGKPEAGKPKLSPEDRVSECLGVNGCKIPLGRRPVQCISFACSLFLKNMDRAEYRRYTRLSLKYLTHLTVSLMAVAAEWRQQARAASAPEGQKTPG